MSLLALLALAISAALILITAAGDPKRRRAERSPGTPHRPIHRWLLAGGALLPGVVCAGLGDPAALLIWLGGCAITGLLITIGFSLRAEQG